MPHASRGRAIISRHPGLCVNHEFPDNAGGWGLCPQCFCGSGSCAPVLAAAQNRVRLSTGPCFFLSTEGILYISPDVCIYCPSWLFDNLQTIFFFLPLSEMPFLDPRTWSPVVGSPQSSSSGRDVYLPARKKPPCLSRSHLVLGEQPHNLLTF